VRERGRLRIYVQPCWRSTQCKRVAYPCSERDGYHRYIQLEALVVRRGEFLCRRIDIAVYIIVGFLWKLYIELDFYASFISGKLFILSRIFCRIHYAVNLIVDNWAERYDSSLKYVCSNAPVPVCGDGSAGATSMNRALSQILRRSDQHERYMFL
jgi:hypothetical protein